MRSNPKLILSDDQKDHPHDDDSGVNRAEPAATRLTTSDAHARGRRRAARDYTVRVEVKDPLGAIGAVLHFP
jgi:hypothetical protein